MVTIGPRHKTTPSLSHPLKILIPYYHSRILFRKNDEGLSFNSKLPLLGCRSRFVHWFYLSHAIPHSHYKLL